MSETSMESTLGEAGPSPDRHDFVAGAGRSPEGEAGAPPGGRGGARGPASAPPEGRGGAPRPASAPPEGRGGAPRPASAPAEAVKVLAAIPEALRGRRHLLQKVVEELRRMASASGWAPTGSVRSRRSF